VHLRGKLEPTELVRAGDRAPLAVSEQSGRDVGLAPAVQSYLADVLTHRPDERHILGYAVGPPTGDIPVVTAELPIEA